MADPRQPFLNLLAAISHQIRAPYPGLTRIVTSSAIGSRAERRAAAQETRRHLRRQASEHGDLIRAVQEATVHAAEQEAATRLKQDVQQVAAERLRGIARTGPLKAILDDHAGDAANKVADILTRGVELGLSPQQVADRIEKAIGGGAVPTGLEARSILIARTEMARAERAALSEVYTADGTVTEWQWKARLARNTCGLCWGMHGTIHPIGEPMATHVACQCQMIPILPGTYRLIPGVDQFEDLDGDRQLEILGPAQYRLYKASSLTLDENPDTGLVQATSSPLWGPGRRIKPLT